MAKLFNPKNFSDQFGESFIRTLEMDKQMRQRQEEFNRQMQFENRQLNFLQDYRNKSLEAERNAPFETSTGDVYTKDFSKQLWQAPPMQPKPLTQSRLKNYQGGVIEEQYQISPEGEVITGYENIFSPDRSDKKNEEDKTPYYDLTKSGLAFNQYKELQSGVPTEQGFNLFLQDKPTTLTQKDLEGLKKQKIKDIEIATDNEARQINSKVPGFYSTFQGLLNTISKPEDIDREVNKYLSQVSTETRDAMKTLLKRRIFK